MILALQDTWTNIIVRGNTICSHDFWRSVSNRKHGRDHRLMARTILSLIMLLMVSLTVVPAKDGAFTPKYETALLKET